MLYITIRSVGGCHCTAGIIFYMIINGMVLCNEFAFVIKNL